MEGPKYIFIAKKGSAEIEFDLTGNTGDSTGMSVIKASLSYRTPYGNTDTGNTYTHINNKLFIKTWMPLANDDTLTATIEYKGIPTDGPYHFKKQVRQTYLFLRQLAQTGHTNGYPVMMIRLIKPP